VSLRGAGSDLVNRRVEKLERPGPGLQPDVLAKLDPRDILLVQRAVGLPRRAGLDFRDGLARAEKQADALAQARRQNHPRHRTGNEQMSR
jgi:hypothetical protein